MEEVKKKNPSINLKRKNVKRQNITQLVFGLLIIILLNVISSFVFTRLDLTSEKRYSLSPATKKLLKGIDDIVYFRVYLDGDFPAGFKRLRNETREMLNEFRAYNSNIQYEFINPSNIQDKKDRNSLYQLLVEKGLQPTDLQVKKEDGSSRQIIFPGALATYKNSEMAIQLLVSQVNTPPEAVLNSSVQALEYNLANAIRKLSTTVRPSVAFIDGQGELNKLETGDIMMALSEFYQVDRVTINKKLNSLTFRDTKDTNHVKITNKYKAIIIAKPDSAFDERDKFIIDQYVMRGGKVIWLVDPVFASMDSLQKYNETMGLPSKLNIEDQLFKYGARLNSNLVLDMNAMPIPVKTGMSGNQPQFDFYQWYYFPILTPTLSHPIVKNLNAIKSEFISSIDTVGAPSVRKTPLLTTSRYSRVLNAPTLISLSILNKKPDPRAFKDPPQLTGVLLEGKFTSLYTHRLPPELSENKEIAFVEESPPTAQIVFSDGDLIKNYVDYKRGVPYPLGYDRYTRETFGNKDLILNAVDYLCDESGLIGVRSRELKLRMLDQTRVQENKIFIQIVNVALPVLLVLGFGLIQTWLRKRKYANPI